MMDEMDSDSDSDSDTSQHTGSDSDIDDDDQSTTTDDGAAVLERRSKFMSLLERINELPLRTRNKLDALVERNLDDTQTDIHDMLCATDIGSYQGLDSNRDTEAEVETAIRFFPAVILSTINGMYPIQWLYALWGDGHIKCNVKAVSFIHLLARLAIEFRSFEEHERGGLLIQNDQNENVLQLLMYNSRTSFGVEHNHLVDTVFGRELLQLRRMNLFIKDDICDYGLALIACQGGYFSENRFRFVVEWDPTSLQHSDDDNGLLPLHYAALVAPTTNEGFSIVFEYYLRYFPNKSGLHFLFKKDNNDIDRLTPFQSICANLKYEQVMKVVEETLVRVYSSSSDNTNNNNNTPPPPPQLNIMETILTAAIDDNIHLDCVYFLLRRHPDILLEMLSTTSSETGVVMTATSTTIPNIATATTVGAGSNNNRNGTNNDNDNDNDDDNDKVKSQKRKREEDHT